MWSWDDLADEAELCKELNVNNSLKEAESISFLDNKISSNEKIQQEITE